MLTQPPASQRDLRSLTVEADFAIIGGGLAGTCAAITAARQGLKVVLVQDRPVLGGNASSEVRLWALGATSHMSNNNRWSREGGVADELLVENTFRNPEGNPLLWDALLLEKVKEEPNIRLLLNTAAFEVQKSDPDTISAVRAFCSQNSTLYEIHAPLWCDASGDGVLGFLSGAAFRIGAEATDEFDEKFAPSEEYGHLLGHSIYFYSKDTGRPVQFIPPSFALADIDKKIPRFRAFNSNEYGCRLWWIEYGGRLDTIHDTEEIKWELWRIVYGVWDYIKNSGEFPDAANLTLEWIGTIPGKRESRRFEGDYMLNQRDIVEQRHFEDAVAFGGWSIDLHPADGVFSEKPGCNQWHSKGVYGIPYRCLYSRNIHNLFLAGRVISASHVAFGSTRVMVTCAHAAQAVAVAAALCHEHGTRPADLTSGEPLAELQLRLLRTGQHIPGFKLRDPEDLARRARISASSELQLTGLRDDGPLIPLNFSRAQMLPVRAGKVPEVTFLVDAAQGTNLRLELRASAKPGNFTPEITLWSHHIPLEKGANQRVAFDGKVTVSEDQYLFFCLLQNPAVSVHGSSQRLSGVLSVANYHAQNPPEEIGVDSFEFWRPDRRPQGHNFAFRASSPLGSFAPRAVTNGLQRPTIRPNIWMAEPDAETSTLHLEWPEPQFIQRIELAFDSDFDHAMETVLMGHPDRAMPFCVRRYRVLDEAGRQLVERLDNHQTRNTIHFAMPVQTRKLSIEVLETHGEVPAAIFEVRCY